MLEPRASRARDLSLQNIVSNTISCTGSKTIDRTCIRKINFDDCLFTPLRFKHLCQFFSTFQNKKIYVLSKLQNDYQDLLGLGIALFLFKLLPFPHILAYRDYFIH